MKGDCGQQLAIEGRGDASRAVAGGALTTTRQLGVVPEDKRGGHNGTFLVSRNNYGKAYLGFL